MVWGKTRYRRQNVAAVQIAAVGSVEKKQMITITETFRKTPEKRIGTKRLPHKNNARPLLPSIRLETENGFKISKF